jgi:hypothetical protein
MLQEKSREDFDIAFRALTWLCLSQLPLKLRQLACAAVLERDSDVDDRSLFDPYLVLEVCRGLVEMDPKTEIVTVAHTSVREFLHSPTMPDKSSNKYFIDSAISIPLLLERCLYYLQLPRFTRLLDPYQDEFEKIDAHAYIPLSDELCAVVGNVEDDDFYVVAALSWTLYANDSSDRASIEYILAFFKAASFRLWALFWSLECEDNWQVGWLDMETLMSDTLNADLGTNRIVRRKNVVWHNAMNTPFCHRITPLYIAVRMASVPLTRNLLSMEADPDAQGGRSQYPLSLAISLGSVALAEELLRAGANPQLYKRLHFLRTPDTPSGEA